VNTKIFIIMISIIILSISFSGCIENNEKSKEKQGISYNSIPIAIIYTSKDTYYFGETIEFDASESYDSDGELLSYTWDFGDEEIAQGQKVKHIYDFENEYDFENDFDVTFPIIYTAILYVTDNSNSVKVTDHQIMLFPKEYKFYFNSGQLTTEKPSEKQDRLTKSGSKSQMKNKIDLQNQVQKAKFHTL